MTFEDLSRSHRVGELTLKSRSIHSRFQKMEVIVDVGDEEKTSIHLLLLIQDRAAV